MSTALPEATDVREPHDLISQYQQHLEDLRDLGRISLSTIETYVGILRHMDAELPAGLASANTDELRGWISGRDRAIKTRSLYRTTACGFFRWATSPLDPILDFDPAQLLASVRVPRRVARPIRTSQLADILARAAAPYRLHYTLAAYAGLRCCEIAALDIDHVTVDEMWIQGKGGGERLVPTHFLIWEQVQGLPDGPVVLLRNGARASRKNVQINANRHLHKVLGYQDVTMHRLRHWFGTEAYEASGKDIRATQELLGHASMSTTQGYVATRVGPKRQAVTGLPLTG